jgi:hypothetical protein
MCSLIALVLIATLWSTEAWAEEPRWQPEPSPSASGPLSVGPAFAGMGYLFPLRLHLTRGGTVDGTLGGIDVDGGQLLLLLSRGELLVDFRLVGRVTPLAPLLRGDGPGGLVVPPPLKNNLSVKYRWQPTWRSHLGVALSFLLPGLGQFIQTRDRQVGFLVLSGALSSVAVGLLALYGPSASGPQARRGVAGVFFGLGGAVAIGGAIHAYRTGRERVVVRGSRLDR